MSLQSSQEPTPSHTQPDQPTEHSGKSSSAVSVLPVSALELEAYWGALEPFMIRIVESQNGKHSMASLLTEIIDGDIQVWAVVIDQEIKAVFGTQLVTYPTGLKTCAYRFVSGSGPRKWVNDALQSVEEYAMENGCDRVEVYARKAWARMMGDYKIHHVHLEKEL